MKSKHTTGYRPLTLALSIQKRPPCLQQFFLLLSKEKQSVLKIILMLNNFKNTIGIVIKIFRIHPETDQSLNYCYGLGVQKVWCQD